MRVTVAHKQRLKTHKPRLQVKVFTDDDKRRTGLYFDPSRTPYMSAKEEREAEEARGKGTRVPSSKDAARNSLGQEGGIDIVVVIIG